MKGDFVIDNEGLHLGSKTYIGECLDYELQDIGRVQFNTKVLYYPNGKYQVSVANNRVFRVPVPGVTPYGKIPRHYVRNEDVEPLDRSERLDNVNRAKNRLYQIVLLNEWDYFLTLTFDDNKVDAHDVPKVIKKAQNWFRNMVQRNDIAYLVVPEYHHNEKRVHLHCLIKGKLQLEFDNVYKVKGFKKPLKISTIARKGIPKENILYPVYRCPEWKYGFSAVVEVFGSLTRLANYTLKYITKDLDKIFGKYYWCSRNLNMYPVTAIFNGGTDLFYQTPGKVHYVRGSDTAYKYINRLGDSIEELSDGEETI